MKLFDYIRSDRRGRDANLFEQEAMDDPFLSDALEGYDAVYGDHMDMVKRLENWVDDRSHRRRQARRRTMWGMSVAAAVVLAGAGIAFYYYSGFRPVETTVAELLQGENVKTYISAGEFLSVMEPPSGVVASVIAVDEKDTASVLAAGEDPEIVKLAAIATDESMVAAAGESTDTAGQAATLAAARTSSPQATEAKQDSNNDIAAAAGLKAGTDPDPAAKKASLAALAADVPEPSDTVYNAEFLKYFEKNHRSQTGPDGRRLKGTVVLEFRVNDAGVPSAITVLSSFSQDANREAIEMLVEGPRWEPTHGRRIRTVLTYE